jgi:hypothetical protein
LFFVFEVEGMFALDCYLIVIFVVNKVFVRKFVQLYTTTHIPGNKGIWFNLLLYVTVLMTFMGEGEAIMVQIVILLWLILSIT